MASGSRKSFLPRLSRPNVGSRLSNVSTQKSARSSSVGRHLSIGKPIQLFTSKRSNSYTNLKDAATPTCRLGIHSSITPRTFSASKYPINDKQWQSSQLTKVKNFFLDLDPDMPPLKPLSLKLFVHTMNLLLRQLDERIEITVANYKDDIPKYFNLLNYPNQIKASVMKNPGVPSNWSHIFAMWVWLIDRLSWLMNTDVILRPRSADPTTLVLHEKSIQYMITSYTLWNNGEDTTAADKDFRDNIAQTLNVDLTRVQMNKLENEALETELSKLHTHLNEINTELEAIAKKTEQLKAENTARVMKRQEMKHNSIARKTNLLNKKEVATETIRKRLENIARLKEVIQKQTCNYETKIKLKNEIAELEYAHVLKTKLRDERQDNISEFDHQLSDERQLVQETVCEINSVLSKNRVRPELMELRMRETGFFQTDMIDEVKSFIKRKKEFDMKLKEEEEYYIKKLKETEDRNQEVSQQNKCLEKEISKLLQDQSTTKEDLDTMRIKMKKSVEAAESKEQQLNALISEMKTKRPNVAEIQEKLEQASKRWTELLAERNRFMEKGEEFFANIHRTTMNKIAAQVEMQQDITGAMNEAIKAINNCIIDG